MRKKHEHLDDAPVAPGESAAMEHVAFGTAFFAALAVAAIAFELRRETVALWRLAPAPLAALACALSLPPEPRWLGAAIGATVIGSVAGAVRGLSPAFRVALSIAVIRAPCSPAALSSSAV